MPLRTRSKTRSPASTSSSSSASNVEVRQEPDVVAKKPAIAEVDKENVKKSAFQPPSPLTSKRSKSQKASSTKKILSPNRNSQWTRNRESSATASSARQPRSSPIHTAGGYSHQVRFVSCFFLVFLHRQIYCTVLPRIFVSEGVFRAHLDMPRHGGCTTTFSQPHFHISLFHWISNLVQSTHFTMSIVRWFFCSALGSTVRLFFTSEKENQYISRDLYIVHAISWNY